MIWRQRASTVRSNTDSQPSDPMSIVGLSRFVGSPSFALIPSSLSDHRLVDLALRSSLVSRLGLNI